MNLNKHMNDGLKRSLKILKAVKVPKCDAESIHIGTYSNGRENGLCVRVYAADFSDKVFVFAEYRNSDQMVLYSGTLRDFTIDNKPTEFCYKQKEFFSSEEELIAVLEKGIAAQLAFKEAA